jgi:hypothetical protein
MIRKLVFLLFICCVILNSAVFLLAQELDYSKFLTVADIQKVTGLSGVKQVSRNPQRRAGGHLNFERADNQMILIASFLPLSQYEAYKNEKDMVKSMVQGIGEEAFIGPGVMDPQYMLVFKKGNYCVAISTFVDVEDPDKTTLTMNHVIAIGKIVAGRI